MRIRVFALSDLLVDGPLFLSLQLTVLYFFQHIVLLKFTEGTSEEQKCNVKTQLQTLPSAIPQIIDYQCDLDLGLDPSRNHDLAITADFACSADYDTYAKHEAHVAVITKHIKPILAPGGRAASQFSIKTSDRKKRKHDGTILRYIRAHCPSQDDAYMFIRLNTSNQNKLKEFRHMFAKHGADLHVTKIDLKEIDSTAEKVVAHKVIILCVCL